MRSSLLALLGGCSGRVEVLYTWRERFSIIFAGWFVGWKGVLIFDLLLGRWVMSPLRTSNVLIMLLKIELEWSVQYFL